MDIKVALVGNPNTGKSTLFNRLTGLNQKIGNFPGITVDKKTGFMKLANGKGAEIIDLPGTYSLYPKSSDESIVFQVLADSKNDSYPDVIVLVVDASNLKRNMLLYSQVADLGIPMVLALNMIDLSEKQGIQIDLDKLAEKLGVQVVSISARNNIGIDQLKLAITNTNKIATQFQDVDVNSLAPAAINAIKSKLNSDNDYYALQVLHQHEYLKFFTEREQDEIEAIEQSHHFESAKTQAAETILRYKNLSLILSDVVTDSDAAKKFTFSDKLDSILTHKIWGFAIFLLILFVIFNAIFAWSSYPMQWIEAGFGFITEAGHEYLPAGMLTNLVLDGIVAGLGGIFVFIPQIAILFAFISILEDTGYMARVTFMMDKIMSKVGLNGKSVVPMIGGLACAVPSIMAARNIENWKDRMITIMVTPLVSCSARLPVYILIISLIIPSKNILGVFNLQGLALMVMYLVGVIAAVLVAWVMKFLIKTKERSYFIMELPIYRMPRWKNVLYTMYEKSKTFVFEAGKVIIAISIILWVMATFGPGNRFDRIDQKYASALADTTKNTVHIETLIATEKLENSYVGILGHWIEPAIRPLGYDWKIGIGLITSFAAREAFVGTMATIYSVDGGDEDTSTIRTRMSSSVNSRTGLPVYTFATGISLMLFYAFAMQCMSTVAIVYRETKGWKWPVIQLVYMTAMAYFAALIAYQLLK
ncbi:ferrous iron transport protein B [Pedobacter psychrotolerans]|uniref:Ferrous iron transport protein B n=1 Tax=Pedobacter psychrotolerans TaxID=1843235 RepID=A0A4R2HDQ0_9SPHI|nr:ferrous iron transport protein B [Pedobacter psychrotolerans]TCO23921.1 ferrous iron transport protein B [Pedobacter psychrotolerans]GGE63604.1 ferrous iron transport protein B [Pedobacter psychrotolerans]